MFKTLMVLFGLVLLMSCGSSEGLNFPERNEFNQEIAIFTPGPKEAEANRPVFLMKDNFEAEMSQVVEEVSNLYPQSVLPNCEIGFADSEGFQVLRYGNKSTCAVIFVSNEVRNSGTGYLAEVFGGEQMVVAMTTDVVGTEYPLIMVPEQGQDFNYLVRVMANQGVMASRIKQGLNTGSDAEETAKGYETQFQILELQYTPLELSGAPESIVIPGLPEANFQTLQFENLLFQKWKEGSLIQFLELLMGSPSEEKSW